jgi:uncharacterized membrane protein (DUF485 family)
MSEQIPTPADVPSYMQTQKTSNAVTIALIIAITIVMMSCILACTFTAYIFLVNAPW